MKNSILNKTFLVASLLMLSPSITFSQADTLHIYFNGVQTNIVDSNEAKIGAWAKNLNGKHVDVEVLAYYNQGEFRKSAQARADELFIILNRKARSLITIKSIGPEKGAKSQRTMADIVYWPSGEKPKDQKTAKSEEKPEKKEKEAKKEKEEEKEKAKAEKDKDSKKKEKEKKKEEEPKKEPETEKQDTNPAPAVNEQIGEDEYVIYENGVRKVKKKKKKK